MLTAARRDWAAARALPHGVIRSTYRTDGVHFVGGGDATASYSIAIRCMSGHRQAAKVTRIDVAIPTGVQISEDFMCLCMETWK